MPTLTEQAHKQSLIDAFQRGYTIARRQVYQDDITQAIGNIKARRGIDRRIRKAITQPTWTDKPQTRSEYPY